MGYNSTPAEQWTQDDLDRATAAGDYAAINKARHAGELRDLISLPDPEPVDLDALEARTLATGPVVPGLQPGGTHTSGQGAQWSQADLHREGAAGNYSAINAARKAGLLRHLGA